MSAAPNLLTFLLPLCCGGLFFLIGAGALVYALVNRGKVDAAGQPAQNTNLFIILGAIFLVLSLCACSVSVIIPLAQNRSF